MDLARLACGEQFILDGGTGSELQRRGVDVLRNAENKLAAWSATANLDSPDVLYEIHKDYINCGADIITSNNFWTSPTRLKTIGEENKWIEYASAAINTATKARDYSKKQVLVAAGIADPASQYYIDSDFSVSTSNSIHLGRDNYYNEWKEHALLVSELGADIILAEYMGWIEDCIVALEACAESGLPVFLGLRGIGISNKGEMHHGESFKDLANALSSLPLSAVLLMCSTPENISKAIPSLKSVFGVPIGAYPNIGYLPTGPLNSAPNDRLTNGENSSGDEIFQTQGYTPEVLADYARIWFDMGAQIVGGCCGTTPEHISAISKVV